MFPLKETIFVVFLFEVLSICINYPKYKNSRMPKSRQQEYEEILVKNVQGEHKYQFSITSIFL
jgi:hypothetical protein